MADLPGRRALVAPRGLLQAGVRRAPCDPERQLAPATLPPGPARRGLCLQIRVQTRLLRAGEHGEDPQDVSQLVRPRAWRFSPHLYAHSLLFPRRES